jgi:hypothetical protein
VEILVIQGQMRVVTLPKKIDLVDRSRAIN